VKHGAIEFSLRIINPYSNAVNVIQDDKKPLVTFFCIATNGYIEYANSLLTSIDRLSSPGEVQVILLSDKELPSFQINNIILTNIKITSLAWPWATLMRYHLITSHINLSISENICYVDADSIVHEPFWKTDIFDSVPHGLIFVQHPGYFRGDSKHTYKRLLTNFIKDLKLSLVEGGLGNWEKNRNSAAYVHRRSRKVYVCGGVWMGKLNCIREMSQQLQTNVDIDLSKNLIARWHDESHLNQYYANNKSRLVGPEFCFAKNRTNLQGVDMIIEAVDK
jgi:hypothetical protein